MGDNNEEKVNSNCKKCSIASGVFSGGITGAIFGVFTGGAIGTAGFWGLLSGAAIGILIGGGVGAAIGIAMCGGLELKKQVEEKQVEEKPEGD